MVRDRKFPLFRLLGLCCCRTMTEKRCGITINTCRLPMQQVFPHSFGFKGIAAHLCVCLWSRSIELEKSSYYIFLLCQMMGMCLDLPTCAVFYPRAYTNEWFKLLISFLFDYSTLNGTHDPRCDGCVYQYTLDENKRSNTLTQSNSKCTKQNVIPLEYSIIYHLGISHLSQPHTHRRA